MIEAVRDRLNGGQHDGKIVADRACSRRTATRIPSTAGSGSRC